MFLFLVGWASVPAHLLPFIFTAMNAKLAKKRENKRETTAKLARKLPN
jgi:hypothetical protein